MNGKDWHNYCHEHAVVVDNINTLREGLNHVREDVEECFKEVATMKTDLAILRTKMALIFSLASALGAFVGSIIMNLFFR